MAAAVGGDEGGVLSSSSSADSQSNGRGEIMEILLTPFARRCHDCHLPDVVES